MKHKHADLIHAWADGAEIEVYIMKQWVFNPNPAWDFDGEYRIKPEEKKPVVRWLWRSSTGRVSIYLHTEEEAKETGYAIKLEWSRTEFPE